MSIVNLRRYSLARGLTKGSEFADIPYVVPSTNPTIDTVGLKIWYDVGNSACYDGVSNTLNNLVTGGTFNTATQANTGAGTITIDAAGRGVEFNQTSTGGSLQYTYQNVGSITRSSGMSMWMFYRKNTTAGNQWAGQPFALNRYGDSISSNFLVDTTFQDGVRSEYNTGTSGYQTVWNNKTLNVGTWYFVAWSVPIGSSVQITMLQSDDTTATSSTFNNASPSSFTPTLNGFGMIDSGNRAFNQSVGAHGMYEKTLSVTEMRAIRDAYTNMGYYV